MKWKVKNGRKKGELGMKRLELTMKLIWALKTSPFTPIDTRLTGRNWCDSHSLIERADP